MRRGEFVRVLNNVPEHLVLASLGVLKGGIYGPQKLFQLADGRSLYLDLDVAERLEQTVSVGQEFWLCKRKPAGKGQKTRWDIYLEDPTPHEGESQLERDLRLSLGQAQPHNHKDNGTALGASSVAQLSDVPRNPQNVAPEGASTAGSPPTERATPAEVVKRAPTWAGTLVNHTNELVTAYAECLRHANQFGVTVKPEDVRTLLVTSFINLCQRNGRRGAA